MNETQGSISENQQNVETSSGGLVQTAHDAQDAVKETAQQTLATVTETVQELAKQTTQQASDVVSQAAEQLTETLGAAKEQATSTFATQRDRAIASLNGLASALRDASGQLGSAAKEGSDVPDAIAPIVKEAADRLAQSAEFLRDKDLPSLLNEARDLAKRQPMALIGSMFAIGLVGARLLKEPAGTQKNEPSTASPPGTAPATWGTIEPTSSSEGHDFSSGTSTSGMSTSDQPLIGGSI